MNSKLEQYVEEVRQGLRAMPRAERERELLELRQHLESLAAARRELGAAEEEAAAGTIAQFGAADRVGRQLMAAQRRRRWAAFLRSWPGAVLAVCVSILVADVAVVGFVQPVLSHWGTPTAGGGIVAFLPVLLGFSATGWLSGRLSGRRSLIPMTAWLVLYHLIYIAPQLRHADMPAAIRMVTIGTWIGMIAAAYAGSWIAFRERKSAAIGS